MASTFSLKNPQIQRDPPDAVVYDLSQPDLATITLPTRSTWTSGLHWHERHAEYLRVVHGRILLTLGSSSHIISASDDDDDDDEGGQGQGSGAGPRKNEICIDRHVWHEWRRADVDAGEDVVVVERTAPQDGEKAVFFWNLNGVLFTANNNMMACPPYVPKRLHDVLLDTYVTLSLFSLFRELDNFPVFINVLGVFATRGFCFREGTLGHTLFRTVDHVVSHLALLVVAGLARVFGIVAVRERFTPADARQRWAEKTGQEKSGKMRRGRRFFL